MSGAQVCRDALGHEIRQLNITNHTDYDLDLVVTDMKREKTTDVEDNSSLWMWVAPGKVFIEMLVPGNTRRQEILEALVPTNPNTITVESGTNVHIIAGPSGPMFKK